ncbi:TetR/AcrR family transcriptional regulator [Janibacter alittae]|uniref:TetR/AcrR family transcriptional regulator n=1 Tax=Janibacter alittae TaxID=3115209 RepID=A0ABZ2ML13_9MICO
MTSSSPNPARDDATLAWRDYSRDDLPPMLGVALTCFTQQGYHGTTIRQIAARAGLSVPGLYHHYPSKHALLVAVMSHAMSDLWPRSQGAVAEAGPSVARQFGLLIECLVLFHAHRKNLAFIASSELRSLEPAAHAEQIAARDRQHRLMDSIVEQGVETGIFSTPYPKDVSTAVITMCTGIAQWYQPDGPLTAEQLAERYRDIAFMTIGGADRA